MVSSLPERGTKKGPPGGVAIWLVLGSCPGGYATRFRRHTPYPAAARPSSDQTGLVARDPCQLVWQVKKSGWLETGRKALATLFLTLFPISRLTFWNGVVL
jgi:hypothetical protein